MVVAESVQDEIQPEKTEVSTGKNVTPIVLSLEILKLIKDAQQQHGLRHGDYQRYRCYCTRRIRRLRKVLKVTQGDRRHFKKKDISAVMLKDERYLCIPLMMTERAWSYAMQLRQEANTEPRKRFHLIQRLRKAATHCLQLQELCEAEVCDARTKLEAEAYVAWIHGSLHFELQLWKPAMENLKKAQMVYEKLTGALPEEDQAVYRARVDELTPSLRYCSYNMGESGEVDETELLSMRTAGQGDLMATLDTLMEKTRQQRAGQVVAEVQWRGRSVQIRPERVRLFLLAEKQLDTALGKAASVGAKIELIENSLMDCKDAIGSVRDEIKSDPGSKATRERGQPLSSLQYLLTYLMHMRLNRTIERNLLMVQQLQSGEGGDGRKVRPQDLTRLYEIILQNLAEMQALPGMEDSEEYQAELEGRVLSYKAARCFYIAEYLVTLKRWTEAMALYERAKLYIGQARQRGGGAEGLQGLQQLQQAVEGSQFAAHAHSVLGGEAGEEEGVVQRQLKAKKPLSERLEEYREDPALLTKSPNVFKLPPEMRPIPCKPLFFDLAFNFAEFPSLDHKMDAGGKKGAQAGLTGFVKGLWGWGGPKK